MPRLPSRLGLALLCATVGWLASSTALANGAFPAPFRIFVPTGRPSDFTVTANFGLIATRDGGKTWTWTCEHGLGNAGFMYQQPAGTGQGTAASGRILGIANGDLIATDDDACVWSASTGFPTAESIDDSFIDPSDAQHVVAIGNHGTGNAAVFDLFASRNGGTTFVTTPLYSTQPGTQLDSVELAKSNPSRVYLTSSPWTLDGTPPRLLRSDDGGKTFTALPPWPLSDLDGGRLYIAAVDPADANTLFFRFVGDADLLLVSRDGGATARIALTADPGRALTAFLRQASGVLLAATFDALGGTLFRSADGGDTFTALPADLHVGSIAERDGNLYVLADGINDGFLVGISRDDGDTIEPFLDLSAVAGVQMCGAGVDLRNECAASCENLQNGGLFGPSVCSTLVSTHAAPAPPSPTPANNPSSGCAGCNLARAPVDLRAGAALGLVAALFTIAAARSMRRPRR